MVWGDVNKQNVDLIWRAIRYANASVPRAAHRGERVYFLREWSRFYDWRVRELEFWREVKRKGVV